MTIKLTKFALATLAAAAGLTLTAFADDPKLPPPSTKTGVTYDSDIKAIFDASCVKCHSGNKPKARLRLDSLAGALKGSKEGKVVKPGDSANSVMVKAVAHAFPDQDDWMPPLGNKAGIKPLTPEQIGLIRAWIDQGAK